MLHASHIALLLLPLVACGGGGDAAFAVPHGTLVDLTIGIRHFTNTLGNAMPIQGASPQGVFSLEGNLVVGNAPLFGRCTLLGSSALR